MPKALLDTSANFDIQRAKKRRNEPWAICTLRHLAIHGVSQTRPAISVLTIMEISAGFQHELRDQHLTRFLGSVVPMFEIVSFDIPTACLAGEIFAKLEGRGNRIGVADTCIAATAILNGFSVVTSNLRHYNRIVDLGYPLNLENWREP